MMLDDRARLNEGCCAKWREINLGDNDVDAAWIATKERQTPHDWCRPRRDAVAEKLLETLGPHEPDELVFAGAGARACRTGRMEAARQGEARCRRDAACLAKHFRTMLGELGPPPHVSVAALAARARRRHDECYRLVIDAKAPIGPKFSSRPSSRSG